MYALRHIGLFASFVGSRARPNYSRRDASVPFAAGKKCLCPLVRYAQLGIGRNAGRITRLPRYTGDFHNFSEARLADSRRGGVQVGDPLGINPGRVGPRARPQVPVAARFAFARGAFFQFPDLKSSTNDWT